MSEEQQNGKVCLVLLEAIGSSEVEEKNAVKAANMEYLNSLKADENCLTYELEANGTKVGLPEGKIGNNGIGTLVIGTGKRQLRNIVRINKAIEDGSFQQNEVLTKIFADVIAGNGRIHFIGCITDSEEEADIKHVYALLNSAKAAGVREAFVHCILDGEDIPNGRGLELTKNVEDWTVDNDYGVVGSVVGKHGILDVSDKFDTIEKYMKVLTNGDEVTNVTASDYIQLRYDQLEEDLTIAPSLVNADAQFQDGDHVFLFNARTGTSAVLMYCLMTCDTSLPENETTKAIIEKLAFMKKIAKPSIHVSSLVQYADNVEMPVMFLPLPIEPAFTRTLGSSGKKQLRVSEESRYTHIKFLLSGAGDSNIENDDSVMIHDKTGMKDRKALIVSMDSTANLVNNALKSGYYDVISTFLAGAGIAASTHSFDLTVDMCKEVDRELKSICETAKECGYTCVVVGTHSEACCVTENEEEKPVGYNVPCIFVPPTGVKYEKKELDSYSLENVAASILTIVGCKPEAHMEAPLI